MSSPNVKKKQTLTVKECSLLVEKSRDLHSNQKINPDVENVFS